MPLFTYRHIEIHTMNGISLFEYNLALLILKFVYMYGVEGMSVLWNDTGSRSFVSIHYNMTSEGHRKDIGTQIAEFNAQLHHFRFKELLLSINGLDDRSRD